MSEPSGAEPGAQFARAAALAVLRTRSTALAVALLPAAVAVVLSFADATGRIGGAGWDAVRWISVAVAAVVLLLAGTVAAVVVRARPAVSPTVPISEEKAPDLYRMVRDLADRLEVPPPSAVALTPDCDSWLEDRTHPAAGAPERRGGRRAQHAPVLVIGSPFLWWMRVAELRAVLAPVVAGTGPSAQPDIAAARRFVRGLDAAVAVSARRPPLAFVGWAARLLLRGCRDRAADMERGVAASASARAQAVDYGLRIVAQEQVGLAYAGWDRLLTRVALPAWRMGRWPSRLDAGVVSALSELSRRDRLAEGFTTRLGERPACDLLEEPGAIDEAASLLAARLFHGGPAAPGPDWAPIDWAAYPAEVVDRKWRQEAARLHRVLDSADGLEGALDDPAVPHDPAALDATAALGDTDRRAPGAGAGHPRSHPRSGTRAPALHTRPASSVTPTLERVVDRLASPNGAGLGERLAERLSAEVAREETAVVPEAPWEDAAAPLFPVQAPRTGRELLADHVAAMVCCAAVDTVGATPGLDWLDGPVLLVGGRRGADLGTPVLSLLEDGDPEPLRDWLATAGVRPDKPVRLV
ncbi:hypothetical protein AB0C51_01505 [Streptomyces pathocidini]|uniref:hypothetical protein n=1 Tax=Streptomyces pathocidini TaxID=1650571 RepID=UPI0033FCEAFA